MTAATTDTRADGPSAATAGRLGTASTDAGRGARDAVLARYDELAELLAGMDDRPPGDPALGASAAPVLMHEARLLDAGRFEDWLAGWTDDAVLWLPLSAPAHPGTDQALLLDDRRRLGERVGWRRDPSAWGQQPRSRTTRVVGGIEAWPRRGGGLVTRSTLQVEEYRHGRRQTLAGHQIHEFVGDGLRRRTKILVVPALAAGVRNPSFLL